MADDYFQSTTIGTQRNVNPCQGYTLNPWENFSTSRQTEKEYISVFSTTSSAIMNPPTLQTDNDMIAPRFKIKMIKLF